MYQYYDSFVNHLRVHTVFIKKYITTSINYLNDTIQGLKNNHTDVEYKKMSISEFNKSDSRS